MGRPKKEEKVTFTSREIRLAEMRNGRIEKKYLAELVMDYKFKKKIDPTYSMPKELAEVVIIIVDKMLGSPSWRSYSEDWKEEFKGRAIEHVIKYAHNFDPAKSKSGKNDPYNYFAMIISNAFIQSWRKCKTFSENSIQFNGEYLYRTSQLSQDADLNFENQTIDPNIESLDWGHFGQKE